MNIKCGIMVEDKFISFNETVKVVIKDEFKDIAMFVSNNSENKTLNWEERKLNTINTFKDQCLEVQMIIVADKLSNLKSFKYDYDTVGDELWSRFKRI